MRMLSGVLRSESLAVGSRPALSTADSIACTEVLYRGGQTIARRGSEQRCGTIYAIWRLYRCTLLTGRAYAHPGSMSMAASVLGAASCPTQHTIVSSLADKRGQPKAVAQRLSPRAFMLTLRFNSFVSHQRRSACSGTPCTRCGDHCVRRAHTRLGPQASAYVPCARPAVG